MSFEIILLLFGGVLILFPYVRRIVTKWFNIEGGTQPHRTATLLIQLLGVGCVICAVVLFSQRGHEDPIPPDVPEPVTAIVTPSKEDTVPEMFVVEGTRANDQKGDLWIVIEVGNVLFPQASPPKFSPLQGEPKWRIPVRFGGDKDSRHLLCLYETDSAVTSLFRAWLHDNIGKAEPMGFQFPDSLPGSFRILEQFMVTRK